MLFSLFCDFVYSHLHHRDFEDLRVSRASLDLTDFPAVPESQDHRDLTAHPVKMGHVATSDLRDPRELTEKMEIMGHKVQEGIPATGESQVPPVS